MLHRCTCTGVVWLESETRRWFCRQAKVLTLRGLGHTDVMRNNIPDLWAKATALTSLEFYGCTIHTLPPLQAAQTLKGVQSIK